MLLRRPAGKVQAPEVKQTVGGSAVKGTEGPMLQKGLDAIASSLSLLGDTLGTAIEVCRRITGYQQLYLIKMM